MRLFFVIRKPIFRSIGFWSRHNLPRSAEVMDPVAVMTVMTGRAMMTAIWALVVVVVVDGGGAKAEDAAKAGVDQTTRETGKTKDKFSGLNEETS